MTARAKTDENVSQGTVDGGIVSSGSISKGVNETFKDSKDEITYGPEILQPLIFVDDLFRACLTIESLIKGNILMEQVIESKLLDFHVEKSSFIVIGKPKLTKKILSELENHKIELCGKEMKRKESDKWLGDHIHCLGNNQSVITTVTKRYGLALSTIMDIVNIVQDARANVLGGIMTGIEIFELCVIPFLLNNTETWDYIPREAMELLNKLQMTFYSSLMGVPLRGTPRTGLLWEFGAKKWSTRS